MFTLASKDPDDAAVAPRMAVAGIVMVLFQVLTAIGVIGSTTFPSCQTNDQCERGSWCDVAGGAWNAQLHDSTGSQRCHVCGDDLPLPLQISADGRSWNQPDGTLPDGNPAMYTFAGYNRCAARPTIAALWRACAAYLLPVAASAVAHAVGALVASAARRLKLCAASRLRMLSESRAWAARSCLPPRQCRAGVMPACIRRPFASIR